MLTMVVLDILVLPQWVDVVMMVVPYTVKKLGTDRGMLLQVKWTWAKPQLYTTQKDADAPRFGDADDAHTKSLRSRMTGGGWTV
ncbi:MAG TPA: hypothetical protein GXX24_11090 [Paracoccus solventivorans]|uniref:Uncharacterized protein n=1 Tax=Paracoccus solventivorans TaxID=53463 RepID=A0A832QWK2_9RHOB|nr:hypothetical protein [Paracoccus solventivorans]